MSGKSVANVSRIALILAYMALPTTVSAQTLGTKPLSKPIINAVTSPAKNAPTTAPVPVKAKATPRPLPQDLLPPSVLPSAAKTVSPSAAKTVLPSVTKGAAPSSSPSLPPLIAPDLGPLPVAQPIPPALLPEPVAIWAIADATALLQFITSVESEGLIPADYQPEALSAAIAAGPSADLDKIASHAFVMLAEDMRDGRTPQDARIQWFAIDPDADLMPTAGLLTKAMDTHDVAAVLASLNPDHGEFTTLKTALAASLITDAPTRNLLRLNIDRWRWLPRDLGEIYIITNVPEFQLRLVSKHRVIRTYRTIVGKPGRTATPQLFEQVQAVVFNPTWTVPQSIVVGEGLGAKLIGNPASALRQGYAVKRLGDGSISVVQQPGPRNSLGLMKIDMPNPHAIYLHDTPSRGLFNSPVRAFSHGCIRTEKAVELGMIMAMLGTDITPEEAARKSLAGKYARVVLTKSFPVYLTYVTFGRDVDGNLTRFKDIYGRDAPALASFNAPRVAHSQQRGSKEEIIKLDNPL